MYETAALVTENYTATILTVELFFLRKAKKSTWCCFSMITDLFSDLGFLLLDGQTKHFEDDNVGSEKLCWAHLFSGSV